MFYAIAVGLFLAVLLVSYLRHVGRCLACLHERMKVMSEEVAALTAQKDLFVQACAQATTAINTLAAKAASHDTDKAAIIELTASLKTATDAMTAAMAPHVTPPAV